MSSTTSRNRRDQEMRRIISKKNRKISSKLLDFIFSSDYLDRYIDDFKSSISSDVDDNISLNEDWCTRKKKKENARHACSNCKICREKRHRDSSYRKHHKLNYHEMGSHSSRSKHKRSVFERDSSSNSEKVQQKREHSYSSERDFPARKIIRRLRSPSSSSSKDCKIVKEIPGLHGMYHCQVCNISMNSFSTYNSHVIGKNHQKALNARNAFGFDTNAFVLTKVTSKCPEPPPGYYRKTLHCPAKIQPYVDENLNTPCPGLNNVIEIQGVTETYYYCSVCNSHCNNDSILPHLRGFKHQLNSLKYFNCNLYEKLNYKQKYMIEEQVAWELRHYERKYGRGLIKVKKDFPETDGSHNAEIETASRSLTNQPSTNLQVSGSNFSDSFEKYNAPDPSKPGYYCKLCDSHSNNLLMWQSHIVGKRHLTNVNKAPGTSPSKCKYICAPMARSYLLDKLDEVHLPVVGLNQIREIRKPKIAGVLYSCFLCCASISELEVVDHILSRKHREKYLENIKHPDLASFKSLIISESSKDSIIEDICAVVESDEGRGTPEVYYAKNAIQRS